MSKKKSNRYQKKAVKNSIVAHMKQGLPTKHNIKNTLLETGKDLVIGVIGGGLVGSAIGTPSLLVGLGVTGLGHFTEHRLATLFGMGIMAANGFQKQTVSGLEGMDGVKERLESYKENFLEKLYITHLLPKKADSVNGMGELQFFNYANDIDELRNELSTELKTLEKIERQIEQSGISHANSTGMSMDETDRDMDEEEDTDYRPSAAPADTPDETQNFDPTTTNI